MEGSERTQKCHGVDSSVGVAEVAEVAELPALHIRGIIHVEGKKNNNLWHLPLVVIIVDIFTGATSSEQSGVSLKTHLRDRITAFDWYSGCGGAYCQNCKSKQKCALLKFWFRLALVFPHIHLYCLGRGLGMGTYRKRYYLMNKCVRGKYLSLFFGAMISLDAKRDRQSR